MPARGRQQVCFDRFEELSEMLGEGASPLRFLEIILVFIWWVLFSNKVSLPGESMHLVNASVVGGVRDEVEREPRVVLV